MKKNLEWKHLCPINPKYSTLYPFNNKVDPLIINEIPDVYFISGTNKLNYEKIKISNKDVFLISLPDFSKTYKCVLYNYENDLIKEEGNEYGGSNRSDRLERISQAKLLNVQVHKPEADTWF